MLEPLHHLSLEFLISPAFFHLFQPRRRDCKNVTYKSLNPSFREPTNQENVSPHSALNLSDATSQLLETLDHLSFEFPKSPAFSHLIPPATLIIFRPMGTRVTINLSCSNHSITWASSFSYHRPRDCKNVTYKSLIPCFGEPTNQQNVSPHSAINLSDATPQ